MYWNELKKLRQGAVNEDVRKYAKHLQGKLNSGERWKYYKEIELFLANNYEMQKDDSSHQHTKPINNYVNNKQSLIP